MITIYKTNSMKKASEYVVYRLMQDDRHSPEVMHTVLVPDRASMEAERQILRAVGGSFNIQVRTFRGLANEILPKYEYLSKQAAIMALTGIIQDKKAELTCFTKGVETAGFVSDMYDTISMMKYCNVSPEQLNTPDLPQGVAGKAHDIALLYKAYLEFTQNRFIDSAGKMQLLCQRISEIGESTNAADAPDLVRLVKKGKFYLYDFDNFSAQELAIVEQLMKYSSDVTVACCASDRPKDKLLYLNDIFTPIEALCKKLNKKPTIVEDVGYSNVYVKQIGENLYRYNDVAPIDAGDFLELYQGTTRVQEVYALACRVQKYVRENPTHRFRDVYVVTSDINKYSNAIATVFDEFDIPYFCDRQFELKNHPYARFVLDYIALVRNNGKFNYVLPFVKNYLFCGALDDTLRQDEDVFHFENYCLKYNISYRYDNFVLGKDEPYFSNADSFRAKFFELYSAHSFPSEDTAANYVAKIRQFIEATQLNQKNAAYCLQQQKQGLIFESKVTTQVQDKFEEALRQAEILLGDRTFKLDEFLRLLTVAVSSTKISVIPVANDCVVFANMAKARKHDIKFLALLGANYGAMPIAKSDNNLLSDRNIDDLASKKIFVEPKILIENKRERFSLFQLLLEPAKRLYVSYAASDGGAALTKSSFVTELEQLFCKNGKELQPTDTVDEDVYTRKQALAKLVLNKRKLRDNQIVKLPSYRVLDKLFGDVAKQYEYNANGNVSVENGKEFYLYDSRISVTRLTNFYMCPYNYYFAYGLYIRPRKVADLQSVDLGIILHDVLEHYVKHLSKTETPEETTARALECFKRATSSDYYKGLLHDGQRRGVFKMLQNEAVRLCEEVKKQLTESEFFNRDTEVPFGGEQNPRAVEVTYNGGKIQLNGKIDRVDVYKNDFIVIDYKSGQAAAEYDENCLYMGKKLQLLVYVKAATEIYKDEQLRPVGFYYFGVHDDFVDTKTTPYIYNGRTLKDDDVIGNIDKNYRTTQKSKLLHITKTQEHGLENCTTVLTQEQITNQVDYALEMMRRAGNLLQQGYAGVTPLSNTCSFCDYKDLCDHKEMGCVDRDVKGVSAVTIDNAMQDIRTQMEKKCLDLLTSKKKL